MAATERRRSPKHPRTRTLPKTDAEKLEERIDLILKLSGGILYRAKRFELTKAIAMSVYGSLAARFDELSKDAAVDLSFQDAANEPKGGE
jgi:hypothetical protein